MGSSSHATHFITRLISLTIKTVALRSRRGDTIRLLLEYIFGLRFVEVVRLNRYLHGFGFPSEAVKSLDLSPMSSFARPRSAASTLPPEAGNGNEGGVGSLLTILTLLVSDFDLGVQPSAHVVIERYLHAQGIAGLDQILQNSVRGVLLHDADIRG